MLLFNFVGMSNSINVTQISSILFTAAQTRKTVNIGMEDVSTNILNSYHLLSYSTLTRQKTKPLPLLKVIGREENSAPRGPTGAELTPNMERTHTSCRQTLSVAFSASKDLHVTEAVRFNPRSTPLNLCLLFFPIPLS